ncbi:MAG: hypothetical protein ACTSWQ_04510, partial [Candidatus Thorarchaeota archaeon]
MNSGLPSLDEKPVYTTGEQITSTGTTTPGTTGTNTGLGLPDGKYTDTDGSITFQKALDQAPSIDLGEGSVSAQDLVDEFLTLSPEQWMSTLEERGLDSEQIDETIDAMNTIVDWWLHSTAELLEYKKTILGLQDGDVLGFELQTIKDSLRTEFGLETFSDDDQYTMDWFNNASGQEILDDIYKLSPEELQNHLTRINKSLPEFTQAVAGLAEVVAEKTRRINSLLELQAKTQGKDMDVYTENFNLSRMATILETADPGQYAVHDTASGYVDMFSGLDASQIADLEPKLGTNFEEFTSIMGSFVDDVASQAESLQALEDIFQSMFDTIFETVTSVAISTTEKQKFDIVDKANQWKEDLIEQRDELTESLSKSDVSEDLVEQYEKVTKLLGLAPSVLSNWIELEMSLIDLESMESVGSSRASLAGTSVSWGVTALESDFGSLSTISSQQSLYDRYMTSTWGDLESWMQDLGYSAEDFSSAMDTIKASIDRVAEINTAKAALLDRSEEYQLALNESAWGLEEGALVGNRQGQQDILTQFLSNTPQETIDWAESLGLDPSAFISSIQDMTSNLQDTNKAFEDMVDTLQDYQDKLLEENSFISPDVLYAQALNKWTENRELMRSSDPDIAQEAIADFPGLSDNLLDLGKRTMTDQYKYGNLWSMIYAAAEEAKIDTEAQITQSDEEFKVLQDNWRDLIKIDKGILVANQANAAAQEALAGNIITLTGKVDLLAKSTDFGLFFADFNELFNGSDGWVTLLRAEIATLSTAIANIDFTSPSSQSGTGYQNNPSYGVQTGVVLDPGQPTPPLTPLGLLPPPTPITAGGYLPPPTPITGLREDATIARILESVESDSNGMFKLVSPGGGGMYDATRDEIENAISGNLSYFANKFGLPGFADGGYHSGGLRIVGERGPELEMTGPSHILSNADTMELFDFKNNKADDHDDEIVEELKAIKE